MNYLESKIYSYMSIRDWGNLIRIVRGFSVTEMAEEIGVKVCTISQFESGKTTSSRLTDWYNKQIVDFNLTSIASTIGRSRALLRTNERLGGR